MHNLLLSDINGALLKPHQSLYETIPEIRSVHSQDIDVDEESIFSDKTSEYIYIYLFTYLFIITRNYIKNIIAHNNAYK
jgi:hypothetical protein